MAALRLLVLLAALAATGAHAVVAQVGFATGTTAGGGAASLSVNVPTGTLANHVMIAVLSVRGNQTFTTPAGWTPVPNASQVTASAGLSQIAYYRVAGGSEPASYTFSWSASDRGAGAIVTYSGASPCAPVSASNGQANAASTTITAPSIGNAFTNTMLVGLFGGQRAGLTLTPAAMTAIATVDSGGGANGATVLLAEQAQAASGATGTRTASSSTSAQNIGQLLAIRRAVDHFEIDIGAATADTCNAKSIVVAAKDASNATITDYTCTIDITTSTGHGDWADQGGGTLDNGVADDGAASYPYVAGDAGVVTLDLANQHAEALTVTVVETAVPASSSTSAAITFSGNSFSFAEDLSGRVSGSNVAVAGRPHDFEVRMVRSAAGVPCGDATNYTGMRTLKVWRTNDGSDPGGASPTIGATTVPAAAPGASNLTLSFASGVATFDLATTDVGKYVLNLRDDTLGFAGVNIDGSAPALTVRPFALAFPSLQHGTTATDPVLAAAGDNVSITVAAYLWQGADDTEFAGLGNGVPDAGADVTNNGLTPGYAWDTALAPTVNLPGFALGAVTLGGGSPTIAQASFSGGSAAVANFQYSEVGNVFLTATASNYLDSGVTVSGDSGLDGTGAAGGYAGRFRPKHFALSAGAITNRAAMSPACSPASTFTSMDERLDLGFTLTAQNSLSPNGTTANYHGAYAKLDVATFTNLNLGARSGTTNLTGRIDAGSVSAGSWSNGVASVTVQTMIRRPSPDAPDGPYAGLDFGIAPADIDTVAMNVLDLDVDNDASDDHKSLGATTELRFVRLRLQNAVGSEKLALAVPIRTEHWTGTGFATNTLDSCTTLGRNNISLDFAPASNLSNSDCETAINAATIPFASGLGTLVLAAPGAGNNGSVLLTPQLRTSASGTYCPSVGGTPTATDAASMAYLLGRWSDAANPDADANTSYDDNPAARAAFGLYGAQPSNFIFFRENF